MVARAQVLWYSDLCMQSTVKFVVVMLSVKSRVNPTKASSVNYTSCTSDKSPYCCVQLDRAF